ncbi:MULTISPECIES: hypothetical protein [unclassified Streptomyces]|uniref:hypothetical protein n=1 Tax=unclassified Streptomyces TaxID=2593676 RepID=UPI0004C13411|nr:MULTISPECIES: hypothetical protein [unclassified Streptomyces]
MAKNKNQNRKQPKNNGPQNRSAQAEHAAEQAHRPEREAQAASIAPADAGPAQPGRKQRKSFGHN